MTWIRRLPSGDVQTYPDGSIEVVCRDYREVRVSLCGTTYAHYIRSERFAVAFLWSHMPSALESPEEWIIYEKVEE
jgi:hypothetical protein